MELYAELSLFLNIPQIEIQNMWKEMNVKREWDLSKNAEEFYKNTNYYLFDLLNWENADKISYTTEVLRYAKENNVRTALDYGCGIGTDGLALAAMGVHVTLADIPSPHFEFAKWRAKQKGLFNTTFIPITDRILTLPYTDFTICIAVLEHIENPLPILKNLLQNTKSIALRVDPTQDGNPMHFVSGFDVLQKLDSCDPVLLEELHICRNNIKDPTIFVVKEN